MIFLFQRLSFTIHKSQRRLVVLKLFNTVSLQSLNAKQVLFQSLSLSHTLTNLFLSDHSPLINSVTFFTLFPMQRTLWIEEATVDLSWSLFWLKKRLMVNTALAPILIVVVSLPPLPPLLSSARWWSSAVL